MSAFENLSWGILGCANIAKKIIPAIRDAKNNELVCISSRSLEKVLGESTKEH
jgi:predicted dehydrogenase